MLPGFNDSHVHLLSGGLSLAHLDLLDATTLDADSDRHPRLRRRASRTGVDSRARAGTTSRFPAGCPRASSWTSSCPTGRRTSSPYDGHTGWANSKALAAAGITRRTPNPKNGTIVKDARTGQPTGVLKESAMGLVSKVLPPVTRDERLTALRQRDGRWRTPRA